MKILMIETALVNFGDDRGGVPVERGKRVEVPTPAAHTLCTYGRALYLKKEDDPSGGLRTAPAELINSLTAAEKAEKREKAA